jgi:hypothetical protein
MLCLFCVVRHRCWVGAELLKNSMRATVEFHGVDNPMPPIKVIIADGEDNEDVVSELQIKHSKQHSKQLYISLCIISMLVCLVIFLCIYYCNIMV